MSTVSADQNTHMELLQITENAVLNSPRTGRLKDRLPEVDGSENVFLK